MKPPRRSPEEASAGAATAQPQAPAWRRAVSTGAKVLFSVGLMAFVLTRVHLDRVIEILRAAHPAWLFAAWLLLVASNVLGAYQWNRLLRTVGLRVPFTRVVAWYHVGLFFNNFLPANIGGDIARVIDASRDQPSRAAAFSTVLMDRLIGTVTLAGLAVVSTLPILNRFHLSMIYVFLLAFFIVSVTVMWAVLHPGFLMLLERILSRMGLAAVRPRLDSLATHLGVLRERRGLIAELIAVALVVQVSRVFVHVLMATALGLTIPVTYFFLFVPLLAVIVSLPISLNGIGVREGAGIVLFGLIGVTRAEAFTLQFATYLVALAVSLLGGLVVLARIPGRRLNARTQRRSS
jgi:glycosyltransferase 2 family protein